MMSQVTGLVSGGTRIQTQFNCLFSAPSIKLCHLTSGTIKETGRRDPSMNQVPGGCLLTLRQGVVKKISIFAQQTPHLLE